jgi:hypothetical protein
MSGSLYKHPFMLKDEDKLRRIEMINKNKDKLLLLDSQNGGSISPKKRVSLSYKTGQHGVLTNTERYRVDASRRQQEFEENPDESMKATLTKKLTEQAGREAFKHFSDAHAGRPFLSPKGSSKTQQIS